MTDKHIHDLEFQSMSRDVICMYDVCDFYMESKDILNLVQWSSKDIEEKIADLVQEYNRLSGTWPTITGYSKNLDRYGCVRYDV